MGWWKGWGVYFKTWNDDECLDMLRRAIQPTLLCMLGGNKVLETKSATLQTLNEDNPL
jgi:hypothetical protein